MFFTSRTKNIKILQWKFEDWEWVVWMQILGNLMLKTNWKWNETLISRRNEKHSRFHLIASRRKIIHFLCICHSWSVFSCSILLFMLSITSTIMGQLYRAKRNIMNVLVHPPEPSKFAIQTSLIECAFINIHQLFICAVGKANKPLISKQLRAFSCNSL